MHTDLFNLGCMYMGKRKLLFIGVAGLIASLVIASGVYIISARKSSSKSNYPAAVLGAKEGFTPLLPKNQAISDSSFTNGVLVYSVTNTAGSRFVVTQQKTPEGFTSDLLRGSRSIPTLYGIAKSTNLNGSTTIGLITNNGVMVTITATPAAGNEQVDALLTSLAELAN